MRSESRTPEARDMLRALNDAGKKLWHEAAVGQIRMVKKAASALEKLMVMIEPTSKCDAF